jgi:HSP20 family protein
MIKNLPYSKPASIYPGIFQLVNEDGLLKTRGIKAFKPPVNIIEFSDYYQIEMPAPGFKREEFYIRTFGCSISIIGKKITAAKLKDTKYHDSSFNHDFLNRKVDLPADADTDFSTAEYKNGVLYIYLYKSNYPVSRQQSNIIVY